MTGAATAVAATVVSKRRARSRARDAARRHVITVFRPFDELAAEQMPGSLTELGDAVKVSLSAAPGGRGTEIAVAAVGDSASPARIRRALRETRSLLEAGDVLLPAGPPTTEPTPLNRPLRAVTRHGREGGLL
ncbi:hypothetical protein [Couchioplanes caeruleus]|nr:hypothetical protein [Couchioplanes caeruleus]ROP28523.1 hypothetical protein EDD30_1287 [Couchioplanes caeruleus]